MSRQPTTSPLNLSPLRDGKQLGCVPLCPPGSLPLRVTFGRVELLKAMWKACGCTTVDDSSSSDTICPDCSATTNWVLPHVSKDLFLVEIPNVKTRHHLWIRHGATYPASMISLKNEDGEFVCVINLLTSTTTRFVEKATWRGPISLSLPSTFQLRSPPNKAFGFLLEESLSTPQPSESDVEDVPSMSTINEPAVNKDQVSVSSPVPQKDNNLGAKGHAKGASPTFRLYFVQRGMDMTKQLIEGIDGRGLKRHVEQRNAIVVDEFDRRRPPTHLVVSDRGIKPELLAETLGFASKEALAAFVREHGIVCVHRKWAARGNAVSKPPLGDPEMIHRYMGLDTSAEEKRQRSPSKGAPHAGDRNVRPRLLAQEKVSRNHRLSDMFKHLSKLYQEAPLDDTDDWRAYNFSNIAGRLRFLDFEVTDDPEVLRRLDSTKGFGSTSMSLVREFLEKETGSQPESGTTQSDGIGNISRIVSLKTSPDRIAMKRMMKIWGVGRSKATELVRSGYRTIEQVRSAVEKGKLSMERNRYIGLLCYDDLLENMDRVEVEAIFAKVEAVFKEKYPQVQMEIMGSYRRGKTSCGDVDVLVMHEGYIDSVPPRAVGEVVDELLSRGFIAHHLIFLPGMDRASYDGTISSAMRNKLVGGAHDVSETKKDKFSGTTYLGVVNSPCVPGRRRRLDIKFYPYRLRAFATLHFTGNGYFNRAMRLWATRKRNWKLSDYGLFERDSMQPVLLSAESEQEIFEKLDLAWKLPHERDCFAAVQGRKENAIELRELSRSEVREDTRTHRWIE